MLPLSLSLGNVANHRWQKIERGTNDVFDITMHVIVSCRIANDWLEYHKVVL